MASTSQPITRQSAHFFTQSPVRGTAARRNSLPSVGRHLSLPMAALMATAPMVFAAPVSLPSARRFSSFRVVVFMPLFSRLRPLNRTQLACEVL